jgi:ABC-type transporter Mla subunit MlaD
MNMANDGLLSAEELEDLAETASGLVDLAEKQQIICKDLLDNLEKALNALDQGTTELTRDMPSKIAHQAAQEVVKGIADLVAPRVEEVLRPAEARAQNLLSAIDKAVEEYRRAARNAVLKSMIASVSAVLAVLAIMKMAGVV